MQTASPTGKTLKVFHFYIANLPAERNKALKNEIRLIKKKKGSSILLSPTQQAYA
jgi:hypothetical protein